jgi:hypothetical protein
MAENEKREREAKYIGENEHKMKNNKIKNCKK